MLKNALENLLHLVILLSEKILMLVILALSYVPFRLSYDADAASAAMFMNVIFGWGIMKILTQGNIDSNDPWRDLKVRLGPLALSSLVTYIVCAVAGALGLPKGVNMFLCPFLLGLGFFLITQPSVSKQRRGMEGEARGSTRSTYEDILKASGQERNKGE